MKRYQATAEDEALAAFNQGFRQGANLRSERVRLTGDPATEKDWAAGFDAGRRAAEIASGWFRQTLECRRSIRGAR